MHTQSSLAMAALLMVLPLFGHAEFISYNKFDQLISYPDKKEAAKPVLTDKSMVAVVFGQSNSANSGGERSVNSSSKILNFFDGRYYIASDPLLGTSGISGSVWVPMAQKLLASGINDQIVLVPAGVGGTSILRWKKNGDLHNMLNDRLKQLKNSRLNVTHFFWHQGESDNPFVTPQTPTPAEYKIGMMELIELTKKYFPKSKFYVAVATRCTYHGRPNEPLQNAQVELAKLPGVFPGPNTDVIELEDRYDDCHFSGRGLEKHANGWVAAIKGGS